MRRVLWLVVGSVAACEGNIGGLGSTGPNPQGGSGGATAGAGTGGSAVAGTGGSAVISKECAMAAPNPGRSPLRRLNLTEYRATMQDLLGVNTDVVNTFPPDQLLSSQGAGFTNNGDALVVTALLANAYLSAAEGFAKAAVTHLPNLLACDPATAGEDVCAKQFIAAFGQRAFRRPLTSEENTRFFALYGTGKAGGTFADGIELVLEALLQSPHFLYRVEKGAPATPDDPVAPVNHFEMATRLSYFFWGTTPDKTLLDAAAAGQLGTPAQIEAQVQEMLKDPRAKGAVSNFHTEWLNLGGVPYLDKDKTMFPEWTPAIGVDLFNEAETFAEQVFWSDGRSDTFFSATYSYVNKELAAFYGATPPNGNGFLQVAFNPAQRAGILTMGGILAANAKQNQTSPVLRGKFVREQLLCQELPPPPPGLVIVPPEVTPGTTTRQRFAAHEAQASCASCHKLMDGMGVGFERYDPLGRWREKDQGLYIDDSGEIVGTADMDGKFNGVVDLATRFAKSAEVRQCIVKQWFRYANGRTDVVADACTLERLNKSFEDSGHDMRDLRVKIAVSDAFRYRSTQGGGQ